MRKAADGAHKSLLYIVYPVELNVIVSEHKVALIAFLKVISAWVKFHFDRNSSWEVAKPADM